MLNLELVSRIVLILQDVAAIAECNCAACDGTCVHAMAKKALADIKAAVDWPQLAEAMSAFTPEQIAAFRQPGDIILAKDGPERIDTLHREIGAIQRENEFLRSQRDSLHAALNRELEKRRAAEESRAERNDQGGTREKA